LLPRFEGLLISSGRVTAGESDPVLLAAVWSVARMRSPRAERLLTALSSSDSAEVSSLGLLGSSLIGSRAGVAQATKLLHQPEAAPLPRAAAAFVLAEAGQKAQEGALTELVEASDPSLSAMAVLSLSRLNSANAPRAIADALSPPEPLVSRAAGDAALIWATGSYHKPKDPLPAPEGALDVRRTIDGLRPSAYSASERVTALEKLSAPLSLALVRAASISPDRARNVAALLVVEPGQLPFAPVTENAQFTPAERARLEALARELGAALLPTFAALARHPSPEVRLFALRFLGQRREPSAKAAIADALKDDLAAVRRAALATLDSADPRAEAAVISLLEVEPDWALRALAATTLGRVAAGKPSAPVVSALSQRASKDPFALVREAALQALVSVDPVAAKRVLEVSHDSDPEPRVKAKAQALLQHL